MDVVFRESNFPSFLQPLKRRIHYFEITLLHFKGISFGIGATRLRLEFANERQYPGFPGWSSSNSVYNLGYHADDGTVPLIFFSS